MSQASLETSACHPHRIAQPPGSGFVSSGYAMGDFAARDRALWQQAPAGQIQGTLYGWLPQGPGALLSDPVAGPNLFVQTDTRYDLALARWDVTAVEMSTARATASPALPPDMLLLETGTNLLGSYVLTETGGRFLLETA